MTIKVLVVGKTPNALGQIVDDVFEFASLPRIGERVCVSSNGAGVDLRVTDVVHSPSRSAKGLYYDGIDLWGDVLDGCYQY